MRHPKADPNFVLAVSLIVAFAVIALFLSFCGYSLYTLCLK
jgi:preprotein translocase subunit Sec61beta